MDIAKSSIKLLLAKIGTTLISFVGIAYFARQLGSQEMGVFFLFQTVLGILAIPADFGLRAAVEKRISGTDEKGEYFTAAILIKLLPIFIIGVSILALSDYINGYIGVNVSLYLIIGLILQELSKMALKVINAELRVGETAIIRLTEKITWASAGTMLISIGVRNAKSIILAVIAGSIVMLVWGVYKISIEIKPPKMEHVNSLIDFSKYSFIGSVGGYFYNWMDVAVLGFFVSQSLVGSYEVAWRVSLLGTMVSQVMRKTIFPEMSSLDSENKRNKIEDLVHKSIMPSMFLVIPMFFGSVIFSKDILGLVFGDEYTVAWLVLIILMMDSVLKSFYWVLVPTLNAINRPDLAVRSTVVGIFVNLIFNIVLVWKFDLIGAAIATSLASATVLVLQIKYMSRFFSLNIPYEELGWCFLASLLMSISLLGIENLIKIRSLYELLGMIFLGGVIYTILSLLNKNIRDQILSTAYKLKSFIS